MESNESSFKYINQEEKEESKLEEKEIYFIISYPKTEKSSSYDKDIEFISENVPAIILEKEIGSYIELRVYKLNIKQKEKSKKRKQSVYIEYVKYEKDTFGKYIIDFDIQENSFVYEVRLQNYSCVININISQDIIPLYDKLEIFLEDLKHNNENDKIEKLYEDTIELYKKKKKYNLLIYLFLKLYDNKNLCSKFNF